MRLLRSTIDEKHGTGAVTLLPEEPDDMYIASEIITIGDLLRGRALRKVSKTSDIGSTTSQRIPITLTIQVISKPVFDDETGTLHVAGRVTSENDHVKLGSHHTLDLELTRKFELEKVVDGEDGSGGWDLVALELLRQACNPIARANTWAVVMGEGIANIVLLTQHQMILRQRVEVAVPRKRKGGIDGHDKGMDRFYSTTLSTLLRHMDLANSGSAMNSSNTPSSPSSPSQSSPDKTVPLVIASPGFTAQSFLAYIKSEASRTNNKPLLALLPSILTAHSSNHHVHSLKEALADKTLTSRLSDTRFAQETALMDRFTTLLRTDDGRAWYGPREIERAVDKGAVGRGGGVLLISSKFVQGKGIKERKRWDGLMRRVKEVEGGEVRILSEKHESGQRLEGLGGIAAILTFPLEGLDESDDEGGEENDENREMVI